MNETIFQAPYFSIKAKIMIVVKLILYSPRVVVVKPVLQGGVKPTSESMADVGRCYRKRLPLTC